VCIYIIKNRYAGIIKDKCVAKKEKRIKRGTQDSERSSFISSV
jgi:hypothetical protein